MVQDKSVTLSNSFQLEYVTSERQNQNISKAADTLSNTRTKHIYNVTTTYINTIAENSNNIINIQLNYDINWALDQDSWNSEFRAIFLYSSIKHLSSDIKNIKELLFRMEKYILSKGIDSSRANNIKDFEGLGKAT